MFRNLAEALLEVVSERPEPREFSAPLEFEFSTCSVREGKREMVRLFAQYPDLVDDKTTVRVLYLDGEKVEIYGIGALNPVEGTNYAVSEVNIGGRTMNSKSNIVAELSRYKAELEVIVTKRRDEKGVPLDFCIQNESFGGARAVWNVAEQRPKQLLISGRHNSIKRYLGRSEDNYPVQNNPLVRALLAEIIAENVVRKLLPLQAEERPGDFPWNDLNDNNVIADDVLTEYQRRVTEFVSDAHMIMADDPEIKDIVDRPVNAGQPMVGRSVYSLAETVQSHPPASGLEHATTGARGSFRKWYIAQGLYSLGYRHAPTGYSEGREALSSGNAIALRRHLTHITKPSRD